MRLIIASNNKNKVREIREILGHRFDEVLSMREAGVELDVVEDADSFLGNARKKALETAALLPGDAVLADDSGLCVDALGGAPGVYSARYAGEGHDDAANRKKLLEALEGVPDEKRGAHFACAMVLAKDGRSAVEAVGRVNGRILFEERGENGFGYDSLFFYEPYGLSFAEIDAERKNAVSHRHNALMLLLAALDAEEIE
ncbi:MAG: RdgB/HAM1 family non-canonical purine NTP pyrophosphatase [Clostridia bacterium]|nr:RdgB/HAM1 family non-canonical purine NTP pyrophosphatase [Clostridia bacterium]